ncbi:hypothetical protein KUTeg_019786 [Tegillarca granosa]|uniref:Major facilitator superfamily (MFS) profile domain-containing protein n=1 Tax=Tegillarca granosa TaxID=220873 RepID=A0ABQ9EJ19_TEGGR|nr:hypothetical protein KUTeg_019786 [Tegillarca granosa]
MIGKLGVSCGFGVIYIIQGEISPTPIRGAVGGMGSVAGLVGGIFTPYIAKINNLIETDLGNTLYLIVFGVLMFSAGLAALLLPETHNRKLPDTIEETEQLKTYRRKRRVQKSYTLNLRMKETAGDNKKQSNYCQQGFSYDSIHYF